MKIFQHLFVSLALIFINYAYAEKPVLVLFPVEVGSADSQYQGEFGSALQEGLQTRYRVLFGSAVEELLEREYEKIDCDAEQCQQNLAIAFNGELVADASAKRLGSGYILKLVITNVITNELVESKTYPCRRCDGFSVIESFQEIGMGIIGVKNNEPTSSPSSKTDSDISFEDSENDPISLSDAPAILLFDSVPSGADVIINGRSVGKTPYQGLSHVVGEELDILLKKKSYKPYQLKVELDRPIFRLNEPVTLEPEEGKLEVVIVPYDSATELYVGGKNLGPTPGVITLSAGRHSLVLKKEGFTIRRKLVSIKAGSFVKITLRGADDRDPRLDRPTISAGF